MTAIYLGMLLAAGVCAFAIAVAWKAQQGLHITGYQSMAHYGEDTQLLQDKQELNRLGLEQLLKRNGGGISALSASFNSMGLVGAAALLFGPALQHGGFSVVGFGLPILALFYICVSAGLAELSSAIPTAGSLSHAAKLFGGKRWALHTGWFHAAGNLCMTALMIGGCAYLADSIASWKWGYAPTWISFWSMVAIVAGSQAAFNYWGAKWKPWAGTVGLWLQLMTIALILGGLAWMFWPGTYSPAVLYQFQGLGLEGGVEPGMYVTGLLLLMKLFLGMDGAALQSEETVEPRVRTPWGIYLSTSYTYIAALVLLTFMALTAGIYMGGPQFSSSAIPGLQGDQLFIQGALSGWGGSGFVVLLVLASLWWSGLQAMAGSSRALFSLGRDKLVPFAHAAVQVAPSGRSPHAALWFSAGFSVALLLAVQLFRPEGMFILLVAAAVVLLHLAYAIPLGLRLRQWRLEKRSRIHSRIGSGAAVFRDAPWHLGSWSKTIHVVALIWLAAGIVMVALFLDFIAIAVAGVLWIAAAAYGLAIRNKRGGVGK
ncbi:amino acid permease [Paenibacillus sp. GCM10027627]|uniref:amino acid permease n=1 Tax=unclassified Paenibacillus TaxID=185978 RepID=UPI00362A0D6A